jgi:hypothetical protein
MNRPKNYLWGIVSNISELYPNARRVRRLIVMGIRIRGEVVLIKVKVSCSLIKKCRKKKC